MPNPLTGDFEAVLQVSGATINRLLASMHQNAGANPETPTFPHCVGLRVGDPHPVDGVRGSAWIQLGSPRIELIHGSRDRFRLEVGVRARYKPDPGSEPLPELIHGTVFAEYVLDNVDPNCRGWKNIAADYVWVRVVDGSVVFRGTAEDDGLLLTVTGTYDDDAVQARITSLVEILLKTTFEATPHKVSNRFRRGSMLSLHGGQGAAVAVPVAFSGDPAGQITSLANVFLEEADFGIALSAEAIVTQLNAALAEFAQSFWMTYRFYHRTTFILDLVEIDITWRITLTSMTAEWLGAIPFSGGTSGALRLRASGQARTQKSEFNVDFDIEQLVSLSFDAGSESMGASAIGAPSVDARLGGALSALEGMVESRIAGAVGPHVQSALGGVTGGLSFGGQKTELVTQLQGMDAGAGAYLYRAEFGADGVALLGRITLSPRRSPVVHFVRTNLQDGFSAYEAWIPGGTITDFNWSWSWLNNEHQPGSMSFEDRFLLRRPWGDLRTKFGLVIDLSRPLPGLDGWGQVCLRLRGTQTDPGTGQLVGITTAPKCTRFGLDLGIVLQRPGQRLFLREYAAISPVAEGPPRPDDPLQEAALVEVGAARSLAAANTLVLYADDPDIAERAIEQLRVGLEQCSRVDAGLLVLVLVPDGQLAGDPALVRRLQDATSRLEARTIVNEDARGSWSSALELPVGSGEPGWRLIAPTGGTTWVRDGEVGSEELAVSLDGYLLPSPPAGISYVHPGLEVGARIPPFGLDPSFPGTFVRPCPAPPLGRLGLESIVTFVQPGALASEAAVAALAGESGRAAGRFGAVVVDAAEDDALADLQAQIGDDVVAVGDPAGVIAARFGVRTWPTTVTLDERGRVLSHETGAPRAGRKPDGKGVAGA